MPRSAQDDIATACRILAETGLAELFAGHVSARTESGTILVPAHLHTDGRGVESIQPRDVIEVTPEGEPVDGSPEEPPDELVIHSAILAARDDVNSAVHAHPLHATALSIAGAEITPHSLDAAFLDGEVSIFDPGPRLLYDSNDGDGLIEALGEDNAVLIRGHGAVTVGNTVPEATSRMWFLERAARLQLLASMVGGAQPFAEPTNTETFLGESPEDFLEATFHFLRRRHL